MEVLALKVTDRIPHHQIVGTQVLKVTVGSPKLVDCLTAEFKKDGTRDPSLTVTGERHESTPPFDDMLMNEVEEA